MIFNAIGVCLKVRYKNGKIIILNERKILREWLAILAIPLSFSNSDYVGQSIDVIRRCPTFVAY